MGRLDGKVAVLTGAGSGIARATAQMFTREGAKVVVAEINKSLGADTADRAGKNAIFVQTDVTDDASVKNAMAVAADAFGRIDILHNCAGGSVIEDKFITDVDLEVWDRTIPLDLKGPMLCCRHGVPHLQAVGGGSIINMSSLCAAITRPISMPPPKEALSPSRKAYLGLIPKMASAPTPFARGWC